MEARLGVAPPISTVATEVKPTHHMTIVQLDEAEGLCIYQDTYCVPRTVERMVPTRRIRFTLMPAALANRDSYLPHSWQFQS